MCEDSWRDDTICILWIQPVFGAAFDTGRIMSGMNTWRDRALARMTELGVTQADLMPVFGVTTRGAVGHYLNGRREPSVTALVGLASRLNLGLEELLRGQPSPVSENSQTARPDPATLGRAMRLLSFVSQMQAAPIDFSEDADALLAAYDLVSRKPSDFDLEDASKRMAEFLQARRSDGRVDGRTVVGAGGKGTRKG